MKRLLFVLLSLIMSACGDSRLDGTWESHLSGMPEQEVRFTFKPDGTARVAIGSTQLPVEMAYRVEGDKIITGDNGDYVLTILDNGDLLAKGVRLTKVPASLGGSVTDKGNTAQLQASGEWSQAFRQKTLKDCSERARQNNDPAGVKLCECIVETAASVIPENKAGSIKENPDVRETFERIAFECQRR